MIFLTVKDIIKAHEICFLKQSREECGYCEECPLFKVETTQNCQTLLAEETIKKLNELVELLDDKVNHHYYDTLEELVEENSDLRSRIEQVLELLQYK